MRRDDEGQLLLLVLGYVLIGAVMVTVVVDLSIAYLHRRALAAAADGAALAAANQPDLAALYSGAGDELPLSERGTASAVDQYVQDAQLGRRFDDFEIVEVGTDGQTVTVTFAARVQLPLVNLVSIRYADGYPVDATATARSPIVP